MKVRDEGSIVLLTPENDFERSWVDVHVDVPDYMWIGRGFAVEHRYALDIVQGAMDSGIHVRQE